MGLSQLIYTSTCVESMTPKMAYQVASQSVSVCLSLGLTGRVFANAKHAFFVTEGETSVVQSFYKATEGDVLSAAMCLLSERKIEKREFWDYSVWLNIADECYQSEGVNLLTHDSVSDAFPPDLSSRIRIMAEAYLSSEIMGKHAA